MHIYQQNGGGIQYQTSPALAAKDAEIARLRAEVEGLLIASRNLIRSLEKTYAISADDSDDRIYDELPSSSIATAYFNARDAVTNAKGEVP